MFSPVRAQEADQVVGSTGESTFKTDLIWQKERLDEEIATLKSTYQSQLENYLYQDKLYRVAYDQHKQLQTLASIEDLTQKAKNLGISRDEILASYFDLLRLNLIATEGVELSLKEKHLSQLESIVIYLNSHQENLKNLNDKDQVSVALTSFANDQKSLNQQANEVLVLLAIGNLQMIHDKAVVLKNEIDVYLENKKTSDFSTINRASEETNRSLSAAKLKLDAFWSDALVKGGNNTLYLSKFYNDLPKTLNPIYVNLSQSISYLNELLSI